MIRTDRPHKRGGGLVYISVLVYLNSEIGSALEGVQGPLREKLCENPTITIRVVSNMVAVSYCEEVNSKFLGLMYVGRHNR